MADDEAVTTPDTNGHGNEAERRELLCEDCNREYVVWYAPNEVWNKVMRPQGSTPNEPFLCPSCFAFRAAPVFSSPCFVLTMEEKLREALISAKRTAWAEGRKAGLGEAVGAVPKMEFTEEIIRSRGEKFNEPWGEVFGNNKARNALIYLQSSEGDNPYGV